jgi:hypothetical protein
MSAVRPTTDMSGIAALKLRVTAAEPLTQFVVQISADRSRCSWGRGNFKRLARGRSHFSAGGGPTFMSSLLGGRNMQAAGSHELGYASAALLLGLFDVLASKGVLSRGDLNAVIVDAINKLEPSRNVVPMKGAIELIESLFPTIHGSN